MGSDAKVFGFYGKSDSGKTTLIERLIHALAECGIKTAVIKQSCHSESIDPPSKDTHRFRQAGAHPVVFQGRNETVFFNESTALDAIIKQLVELNDPDVILVESARDEHIMKIRLGDIQERANTLMTYDGNFEALLEKILKGE